MDYQCPACRKSTPDVARAFREDKRVRVIYRDTPIFGPRSEAAARAAIASQFQGKHEAFHHALMLSPMPLDEEALKAAAAKAGINWKRLQSDLERRSAEIDRQIAWNMELADATGIVGTPAYIIGDTLANGVLDYKGMKASIADARKASGGQDIAAAETPAESIPQKAGVTNEPEKGDPEVADIAEVDAAAPAGEKVDFQPAAAGASDEHLAGESADGGGYGALLFGMAAASLVIFALFMFRRRRRASAH